MNGIVKRLFFILIAGAFIISVSGCAIWESGPIRNNPSPCYEKIKASDLTTEDGLKVYKP